MFRKSITLLNLFGFEVKIDLSWLILAILIIWTLASGVFPAQVANLSPRVYLVMGLIGLVGLLFSIVVHEMSHSLVARHFGLPIHTITLFLFGGVAQMEEEPATAKVEFLMAIAGPLMSFLLAIVFFAVYALGVHADLPAPINAVIGYLATINMLLGVFNLLPAFPLDGGRVLRALLWGWKKNMDWATRVASGIGAGFGWLLVALGFLSFAQGNFVNGIWWVLIGFFLKNAADSGYQMLLLQQFLEGRSVQDFMKTQPMVVPAETPIQDLLNRYIYKYQIPEFPVMDHGHLVGVAGVNEIRALPQQEWETHPVGEIARKTSDANAVDLHDSANRAFTRMNQTGNSTLMVTDQGELAGIISAQDILRAFALKMDLVRGRRHRPV